MSDIILQAIDLSKRFRKTDVLDHLSLQVTEGSVFGLVGINGAGKTTLIKILVNIHQPTAGRTEILGHDSRRIGPADLARIGYVSENQQMPEWMTAGYLMDYLKPFYPSWDDAHAAALLRQFDLPKDRKLRHLSHGMRMKAALASALAYRPKLLVLDEPFTGLDPLVRDELIEGLLDNAEGATIFISSHDLAEIETFVSHIGYLDRGRLQFSEDMASLAGRFREVEITLPGPALAPPQWPGAWLNVEQTGPVVRFIETQFERERTMAEIGKLFAGAQIQVRPMPLRSIFVTLARARRKAA